MFQQTFSRVLPCLAVAAACAGLSSAHADTLYTQAFAETANGGYFASTPSSFLQFDSFVLSASATVTSVGWWGVDLNELLIGATPPYYPSSFTIAIHADNGGAPGALLSFTTVGSGANAVNTGIDLMGLQLFSFSGTLATPFAATAGTRYWLGISDPTDNAGWFWASGSGPDNQHASLIGGALSVNADDMSFTVIGSPVPEPTTAGLLLMGLAGLAAGRLRRQRG